MLTGVTVNQRLVKTLKELSFSIWWDVQDHQLSLSKPFQLRGTTDVISIDKPATERVGRHYGCKHDHSVLVPRCWSYQQCQTNCFTLSNHNCSPVPLFYTVL